MKKELSDRYELLEEKELSDFHSQGMLLRHKKSGARICIISNDDENKVFYIGFRTPPADSTGVAHIVEHTVLCGSDKFPAKDPFVELVKGSLNTFLNAMTYPDKTVYPVASCNEKDFANLMDVYMDAVLHPNIYKKEEIFRQEGWHYELFQKDDPIRLNGVVYNEMKGAFSSPEGILEREILGSLFPDTAYGCESGGDPRFIPDLTYEDYLNFHRTYYHPCNSYIYLYGDMDVDEKLEWLDRAYLSDYEAISIDSNIRRQEPFDGVRKIYRHYPAASSEPVEGHTYLSYNAVIGTALDQKLCLAFEILDYALLSAPGAPLRQALIDAGIGTDIMSSFDNGIFQPIFSIVAKNADRADEGRFVECIKSVLKEQASGGLNKTSLLAGINSMEFLYREADFGTHPKGLIYGLKMLDSWLYDDSQPFLYCGSLEIFRFLRSQVQTDYFEGLIQTYMLENPHVSMVMIEPKRGLNAEYDRQLAERMARYKDGLSEEEVSALIAETEHLKAYQDEPSSREDLEKIPMLKRGDIKREAAPLVLEERECAGTKILFSNLFSNGIVYLNFLFGANMVTQEELPYLGILESVLGLVDTEHYTYHQLANEINLNTGGIKCKVSVYPKEKEEDAYDVRFEIHMRTLYDKLPAAMGLLEEILFCSKIESEKRLKEILAEMESGMQMHLSSAGNAVSARRAMSYCSKPACIGDLTGGIGLYRVVAACRKDFEEKKAGLAASLKKLIGILFTKENFLVSVTCDTEGYAGIPAAICGFKEKLAQQGEMRPPAAISCVKRNEGFWDASKVQYVSRAGNYKAAGLPYKGTLRTLKVILQYEYLWLNVRVKGGAYGCSSLFGRNGGAYFSSFRDPNLKETNGIYEKIPEFIRQFTADEREMTKYIIGTISEMDTPLTPMAKGIRAMAAYLSGMTDEDFARERREVLDAQEADIRELADYAQAVLSQQNLCVIGNEETLTEHKDMFASLAPLF